jgi:LysM repeat protein
VAVASASGQGNAVSANSQGVVRYHIVQKGDTLSLISREYQTTVDMICQLNGISAKKTLRIGEKLIILN